MFIASATFLWGVSASLGRAVFTGKLPLAGQALHPIEPLILSQTRATLSLLLLLPLLVGRRGWQRLKLPTPDLIQCLILGLLGIAASNYFYYVAIQKTSVAIAIVLQYTAPVWVLLYVVVRGQQRLTLPQVVAVAVAVAGISLTIGIFGGKSATPLRLDAYGLIAAMLASLSFAFYNLGGHGLLARHDRWRILVWTLLSAAIFWLVVNPPWKVVAAHYTRPQWGLLFVFSTTSVLLSVLALFPPSAAPGAHESNPHQLLGTGILNPASRRSVGGGRAPDPNAGDRAGALGDRDRAIAGQTSGGKGSGCRRPDRLSPIQARGQ